MKLLIWLRSKILLTFRTSESFKYDHKKEDAFNVLNAVVSHFILIDCAIYASPIGQQLSTESAAEQNVQLVRVVDAIFSVILHQENHIEKTAEGIFELIDSALKTANALLEDPNKAVKLPFFVIFAKKLYEACFERAWFSKSCARGVIDRLLKIMPAGWIIDHGCALYSALLFIIRDLADAVAFGVVEESVRFALTILAWK